MAIILNKLCTVKLTVGLSYIGTAAFSSRVTVPISKSSGFGAYKGYEYIIAIYYLFFNISISAFSSCIAFTSMGINIDVFIVFV